MQFNHKSVLLKETIDNLNINPDGIYVDGTLGGGGHSYEIAKRLSDNGKLIGIDQDEDAIKAASERLKEFGSKVTIVRNNYCNMNLVLDELGITKVDGIILTHGSDTIQYTAALLSYVLKPEIPVMIVCSNYVLEDEKANGFDNFCAAVDFIKNKEQLQRDLSKNKLL